MEQIFEPLSAVFLILTLIVSVFIVGGVFINKFKGSSSEKTYPRWRVIVLSVALIFGYISGWMNEYLMMSEGMSSLRNLVVVSVFYIISTVLIILFTAKQSVSVDSKGQQVDYRSVQFFLVLVLGFAPIILLSL